MRVGSEEHAHRDNQNALLAVYLQIVSEVPIVGATVKHKMMGRLFSFTAHCIGASGIKTLMIAYAETLLLYIQYHHDIFDSINYTIHYEKSTPAMKLAQIVGIETRNLVLSILVKIVGDNR